MDAGIIRRVRLATAAAIATAGAVAAVALAPGAAGGPGTLTPDLVTLAPEESHLIITEDGSKTLLRMTTEIANIGNGPLEVFPSAASANCDGDGDPANDRDASQRMFTDTNGSGGFEEEADGVASETMVGCMRYHAVHDHWHVVDFALYELRREPDGRRVATSRKVGFCLTDNRQVHPGPTTPQFTRYPFGSNTETGCDHNATQGISTGWADAYVFATPGQQLNVSRLKRGRYCLVLTADPLDHLDEIDEANNTRRARIFLRPRKHSVRRLNGACKV